MPPTAVRFMRYRTTKTLWGLPLVDIASGPDPSRGETIGRAKGIIAIGDSATGIVAIGSGACGVIAIGGGAYGICALGGGALGILFAIGGLSMGSIAYGGLAIGLIASGGGAIGLIAMGGAAIGYYAAGAMAFGPHIIDVVQQDPDAVRFFEQYAPLTIPDGEIAAPPMNQSPNEITSFISLGVIPSVLFWSIVQAWLQLSHAERRTYKSTGIFATFGGLIFIITGAITFLNGESSSVWGSLLGIGLISLIHSISFLITSAILQIASGPSNAVPPNYDERSDIER